MVKKIMFLAISVLLAFTIGCGNRNSGGNGATAANSSVLKHDPVELVFYYPFPQDWDEAKFMATFGEPIHKKFNYITVKYLSGVKGSTIPELVTAGQTIDVIAASIGATAANLLDPGFQTDITPLIKKHNIDLSKMDSSMIDLAKQYANGGIYGLPVYVPPTTVYYNKDIFDKFGVSYPKDGNTWDDMYELDKKLTRSDGGIQYYGFGSSYGHTYLLNQRSIPLIDPKTLKSTLYTDDRWKDYFRNFVRMYKLPGYEILKSNQLSEPNERNEFFKDRIFATFTALTALEPEQNLQGLNFDFASYPVFADKPDVGPQAYPAFFYPTATSKYKDDALDAIAYLTSDEFQMVNSKSAAFVPASPNLEVLKAFGQDNPTYKGKHVTALKPKKYAPAGAVTRYDKTGADNTTIKNLILKNQDLNEALRAGAEKIDKAIEAAEAK
ncbi:MAG: hypothetical protein K0R75_3244 [Paenibacillaceae bacterium]|nr:hypothetical protein [Paenibacillaceae bacterium]